MAATEFSPGRFAIGGHGGPKRLYRVRVQAITGKVIVQHRLWGPSAVIPQTEGGSCAWEDCKPGDIPDIPLAEST